MGSYRSILAVLPLLMATGALAQQDEGSDPIVNLPRGNTQPAPDNRQGPELDVFRDPTTSAPSSAVPPPVALPPVVTPTVTPPPPSQPATPTPAPRQNTNVPDTRPDRAAAEPAPRREERPAASGAPAETPATQGAPATAAPEPQATPMPAPMPDNTANVAPIPTGPAPGAEQPPQEGLPWPWIMAGVALLAALAFFFLRRRRDEPEAEEVLVDPTPVTSAPTIQPAGEEEAVPSVPPPSPAAAVRPASPLPVPETPVSTESGPRPLIDMVLEVQSARHSLAGATIAYALTLHNRGEAAAQDLLVRGLIANAGEGQQALLQQFVAGQLGLPLHSTVAVAPGEGQRMTGELRLTPDQIVPVRMGERALLIPLVAFDVHYRWGEEGDDPVSAGRIAGAYIIGQEQDPPVERLSPLRVDLGPRQYRRAAARAMAELARS